MGFNRARRRTEASGDSTDTYRDRGRERERGPLSPPCSIFTGRFSISAGFVYARVTVVRRRDFHCGLFWLPAGRLRSWTLSGLSYLSSWSTYCFKKKLRITMLRNMLKYGFESLTFGEIIEKSWSSNYWTIRLIIDRFEKSIGNDRKNRQGINMTTSRRFCPKHLSLGLLTFGRKDV